MVYRCEGDSMEGIKKIWPNWEPVEVLGKGGFGCVYKAKREKFGKTLYSAIKIVRIPNDESEMKEMITSGFSKEQIKEYYYNSVKMLIDEIRLMDKLKSASYIEGIEDFEVIEYDLGWKVYIRMELLTNILNKEALSIDEVKKMAVHILSALEHCHALNIIHRDIKPGNIFISSFGEYKLGDFGVSKQVERANATMSQKGTKSYMAPEMIRLENTYDHTVDLYALGLTMYELLNHGRMPFLPKYPEIFFPQDREEAMIKRLTGEPFPEIEGIGYLNDVIQKACAFDPKDRYQSATEMKNALLEVPSDNSIVFKDEKILDAFEEKTMNVLESNSLIEEEKTMGIFGGQSFVFDDSVIVDKNETYTISQNDKIYYQVFTHGYYDLNDEVIITSIDSKTNELKVMFESYLKKPNKIEILERMVKMDANPKLYALLGDEYYKIGKTEGYEKAYELDKEDSYILKRMACLKYQQHAYKNAIEIADKGIESYNVGKSSAHRQVMHSLYFIKALSYQALNDEVNAVRAISDLYDFNFKTYHALLTRAENISTIYKEYNANGFMKELTINDQFLSTKHKIFVACIKNQIGGELFKKHMTQYIDKLKDTYLKNPKKVTNLQKKMGIDYDNFYIVATTSFFDDCAFGQYGLYKYVEKKIFFLDYYGIAYMMFGTYDSPNLMIKKIEDYGTIGWKTILFGARKTPYIYLSLCELKHEITQKTTLPLDLPFSRIGYLFNTTRLKMFGIHTVRDLVEMKEEDLFKTFVNYNEYLYMKGLRNQL